MNPIETGFRHSLAARLTAITVLVSTMLIMAIPFVFGQETDVKLPLFDVSQIVFIGIFLGVLTRVALPYLHAIKESATPIAFEWKYAVTAIITVIQAAVFTALVFSSLPTLQGFIAAYSYAYSTLDLTNYAV